MDLLDNRYDVLHQVDLVANVIPDVGSWTILHKEIQ